MREKHVKAADYVWLEDVEERGITPRRIEMMDMTPAICITVDLITLSKGTR